MGLRALAAPIEWLSYLVLTTVMKSNQRSENFRGFKSKKLESIACVMHSRINTSSTDSIMDHGTETRIKRGGANLYYSVLKGRSITYISWTGDWVNSYIIGSTRIYYFYFKKYHFNFSKKIL